MCPTSTDLCVEGTGRAAFSGVTAPPTGLKGENSRELSGWLSPPSYPLLQSPSFLQDRDPVDPVDPEDPVLCWDCFSCTQHSGPKLVKHFSAHFSLCLTLIYQISLRHLLLLLIPLLFWSVAPGFIFLLSEVSVVSAVSPLHDRESLCGFDVFVLN